MIYTNTIAGPYKNDKAELGHVIGGTFMMHEWDCRRWEFIEAAITDAMNTLEEGMPFEIYESVRINLDGYDCFAAWYHSPNMSHDEFDLNSNYSGKFNKKKWTVVHARLVR